MIDDDDNDEFSMLFYSGIRRKRMKGDTWAYKKVCENLLAAARL
jgi:hypothetical protein